MWMRFPFSFAIGVVISQYAKPVFDYIRKRLVLVTIFSLAAVFLSINLQGQKNLVYPMLDLSILPLGLSAVFWLYKLRCNSEFIQFMGKYSLPLYLMQIPLIKYGVFMNYWRRDVIGLLVTWITLFLLAFLINQIKIIVIDKVSNLFSRLESF